MHLSRKSTMRSRLRKKRKSLLKRVQFVLFMLRLVQRDQILSLCRKMLTHFSEKLIKNRLCKKNFKNKQKHAKQNRQSLDGEVLNVAMMLRDCIKFLL